VRIRFPDSAETRREFAADDTFEGPGFVPLPFSERAQRARTFGAVGNPVLRVPDIRCYDNVSIRGAGFTEDG
jgi:hypothetical protein